MIRKLLESLSRVNQVDLHWLIIWCTIYLVFLTLDLIIPNFWGATLLKYTGIFLCLIYARKKFPTDHLLFLALLFTLLADTILVWTNWEIPGVFCFCFAQFFHITRQARSQPKLLIAYFISVTLAFIFAVLQGIPPIYAIAGIYAFSIVANLILASTWHRRDRHNFHATCALIGFLLFIACDACVATQHLIIDGIFTPSLLPLISYLVWLFYYPSQILISNSSNSLKKTI